MWSTTVQESSLLEAFAITSTPSKFASFPKFFLHIRADCFDSVPTAESCINTTSGKVEESLHTTQAFNMYQYRLDRNVAHSLQPELLS